MFPMFSLSFKSLPTFYLWFCFLQGGLIGLAAVAVGLKEKAPAYLEVLLKILLLRVTSSAFKISLILSSQHSGLASQALTTRVEALHWIVTLLDRHRNEVNVISFLNDIFSSLLAALSDPSDELIGLLETPIFAFLRLQVFTSRIQTCISMWFAVHLRFFSELAQCIFGQYMCSQIVLSYDFVQRSAAFKIVRTRLKTVPSNIFNNEQLKHPCSQISEITDDSGDQVAANVYDKINFPSKLQQFQQTLRRHRFSLQSQRSASSSTSQVSASFYGFAFPLVTRSSVALLVLRVI
ncbi:hypothetical protein B296_00008885 [Ensete ventricosum]|uniref:Uncharacterized protein n=1 Tax=Ensete ventricosum TaxID=4639 RepID=A0A427BB08_ENSVE|nr:hypothetical protein B296_00008885 [Ensete ventricosum]